MPDIYVVSPNSSNSQNSLSFLTVIRLSSTVIEPSSTVVTPSSTVIKPSSTVIRSSTNNVVVGIPNNTSYHPATTCVRCRNRHNIRTEYERVIQLPQAATLHPPRGPGTALPLALQAGVPPNVNPGTRMTVAFPAGFFPAPPLAPAAPAAPNAPVAQAAPSIQTGPPAQAGHPSVHGNTPAGQAGTSALQAGQPSVTQAGQPSAVSQPSAPQAGTLPAYIFQAGPRPALAASATTSPYGNPYGPPAPSASATSSPYGNPYGAPAPSANTMSSPYDNPYGAPASQASHASAPPAAHDPPPAAHDPPPAAHYPPPAAHYPPPAAHYPPVRPAPAAAPPAAHRPPVQADPDRSSQDESPSGEAVAESAELESSSHASQEDPDSLRRGNRRATDPEWPSGYPAIAVRTMVPPQDPTVDYLPLDEGHHYMVDSKETNGYVAVLDMSGNRGWAPWDALDVGEMASCREEIITITKALRRRPIIITIVEDAKNGNVLADTVLKLSHALYARKHEISSYNPELNTKFDTPEKRIENAQIFYDGVKAVPADPDRHPVKTLYECLSKPDYNNDSFRQSRAVQTSDNPKKIVFYIWIHSEFIRGGGQYDKQEADYDRELERDELEQDELEQDELEQDELEQDEPQQDVPEQSENPNPGTGLSGELDPNRQPEDYVGKASLIGRRLQQHNKMKRSSKPTKNVNYRAARQATQSSMYHVCEVDPEYADLSWFFEQMVCLLFETSCRELRELPSRASGDRLQERDDANALLKIAHDVFSATRWPGGCISNPNFGSSFGKNWANPIVDVSHIKVIWTKSIDNEGNETFRRPPKALPANGWLFKIGTFALKCPSGHIPAGTQVHVVFEFTAGGSSKHPYAFAAAVLPSLFGVTDITKALSWAVRVEWSEDDSTEKVAYLQRARSHKIRGTFEQCGFAEYRAASMMYSFFHQTIPTFDPQATGLDFLSRLVQPTADLILETFDYKNRVKTIEPLNNVQFLDVDQSPRLLTEQEKQERHEQAFSEMRDTQIGGFPPEGQKACDHCLWSDCPCIRQVDEAGNATAEPCFHCQSKNMLCSFSNIASHNDFASLAHHPLGKVEKDNFHGGELPPQGVQVIKVE
ncbi:hypothetical protein KCU93_g6902, partial [Aureobasidium melanogenum]